MDALFRFMTQRPAQPSHEAPGIRLDQPTKFQNDLKLASKEAMPLVAMKHAATTFLTSPEAFQDLSGIPLAVALLSISSELTPSHRVLNEALEVVVRSHLETTLRNLVSSPEFTELTRRVRDTVVALKLVPDSQPERLDSLKRLVRTLELLRVAATNHTNDIDLASILSAPLILPKDIFPVSKSPGNSAALAEAMLPAQEPIHAIQEDLAALERVAAELRSLPASAYTRTLTTGFHSPRPSLFTRLTRLFSGGDASTTLPALFATTDLLATDSIHSLTSEVTTSLRAEAIDLSSTPVHAALAKIDNRISILRAGLAQFAQLEHASVVAQVGSVFTELSKTSANGLKEPNYVPAAPPEKQHGTIRSVGLGDLFVVRQNLQRYEGGEVAHIENVLASEIRERKHSRTDRTEETLFLATERETQEERDLQTTDRFELRRETEKTIKEDQSLKAGVSVSAKFGEYVEINTNVDFTMTTAKTQSDRLAANYAKDVVSRAVSKVTERIREERTQKKVVEIVEVNTHTFDNHGAGVHNISGVYQWVDKIYNAQVYSYDKRWLFDLTIPEPAAFLIDALASKQYEGQTIAKPKVFDRHPRQIDENNYLDYVVEYEVTGIGPPPPKFAWVSANISDQAENAGQSYHNKTTTVATPSGYKAVLCHVTLPFVEWSTPATLQIGVGRFLRIFDYETGPYDAGWFEWEFGPDEVMGSIPISAQTREVRCYSIDVVIKCECTPSHLEEWQIATHSAILQAYREREENYRQQLEARRAEVGVRISGANHCGIGNLSATS